MRNKTYPLSFAFSSMLCLPAMALTPSEKAPEKKPNIIFILCDDGGYADFGFQGSRQFRTPHLDKLAKKGVIFEQAYTTDAVSGPSRAGLMTGRYQQRFGIEENNVVGYMSTNGKLVKHDMGVDLKERFISDYLSEAGYKCGVFGKWHLGSEDQYHPLKRGYDTFVGFRSGGRSFYPLSPKQSAGDNSDKRLEYGFGNYKEPEAYLTDVLANEACKYIQKNKENPFFVYLAFNAVHSPLEIDPKDEAAFPSIKDPKRRKLAAMALSMDRAIGRVYDTLVKNGLDKNTILVFSNDNGGPHVTNTSNYPLRGMKATFLEGGIRVPAFMVYPGVVKANSRYAYPISFLDFLPTFARAAGVEIPSERGIDGVDLLPYINRQKTERPHQTLYWKCENRGVVRDGDMKFMRFPDRPAELYDISTDEGEKNNLAAQHPELIKKYYQMLSNWEMTLSRPAWMLQRKYEKRILEEYYENDQYNNPIEQK